MLHVVFPQISSSIPIIRLSTKQFISSRIFLFQGFALREKGRYFQVLRHRQ